jgi:hypothetical protein
MELTESVAIAEWLKEWNVTDAVFEKVEGVCYDYINLGVIHDCAWDDDYATAHVLIGFGLAVNARLENKPALWAKDGDMLYYFIGDEDEILEKLEQAKDSAFSIPE